MLGFLRVTIAIFIVWTSLLEQLMDRKSTPTTRFVGRMGLLFTVLGVFALILWPIGLFALVLVR